MRRAKFSPSGSAPFEFTLCILGKEIPGVLGHDTRTFPTHTHQGIVLMTDTTRTLLYFDVGGWETLEHEANKIY